MDLVLTERDELFRQAQRLTKRAVKSGELKPLSECICVDCGAPAWCYDHRDYRKPLEVQPVCRRCNLRRGPGLPLPQEHDRAEYKTLLKGNAGQCYSGLDAGEGFEPLIARLNGITEGDLDHIADVSEATIDTTTELTRFENRAAGLFHTGERRGFRRVTGIARAEYFKRRDPWYA